VEAAPPDRPAMWLGLPATTSHQSNLSKSVELPHGPINTPDVGNERTHTTFADSTYKALILNVVARRSLVERVVRL
jgi:hypothetical protein